MTRYGYEYHRRLRQHRHGRRRPCRRQRVPPARRNAIWRRSNGTPRRVIACRSNRSTTARRAALPPLIKGYTRLGAMVCGEPAWDPDFNTADLLMLLPMAQLNRSYARRSYRLRCAENRRGASYNERVSLRPPARLPSPLHPHQPADAAPRLGGDAGRAGRSPCSSPAQRDRIIMAWARRLLRVLGVRLQAGIAPRLPGGALLVCNHVSWLDIYLIYAAQRVHFVSKAEVRQWPVAGWLAHKTGTLFIERGRRADTARINTEMRTLMQSGAWVAVFPEGTTSDGRGLRRFMPSLLQPAVELNCPIVPAALRYRTLDGEYSAAPAYIDDISMWQSLMNRSSANPASSPNCSSASPSCRTATGASWRRRRNSQWLGFWALHLQGMRRLAIMALHLRALHRKHLPILQPDCGQLAAPQAAGIQRDQIRPVDQPQRRPVADDEGRVGAFPPRHLEPRQPAGRLRAGRALVLELDFAFGRAVAQPGEGVDDTAQALDALQTSRPRQSACCRTCARRNRGNAGPATPPRLRPPAASCRPPSSPAARRHAPSEQSPSRQASFCWRSQCSSSSRSGAASTASSVSLLCDAAIAFGQRQQVQIVIAEHRRWRHRPAILRKRSTPSESGPRLTRSPTSHSRSAVASNFSSSSRRSRESWQP